MQNSMVLFSFSVLDREYSFWANLMQKIKILGLCLNLVPRLTQSVQSSLVAFVFSVFDWQYTTLVNLVQKIKNVSLS